MCIDDFPRGQRVLKLDRPGGAPIVEFQYVMYFTPDGDVVQMNPAYYLFHRDRIILALDCWPRTLEGTDTVYLYYTTRGD